jgi:predicted SnoaL-like aldol condensation-catalyzing enzyme
MSTTANKEIVRRFYEEVFNQRNIDAIDELVHPEFTNHDPTPVASRDPESMKQFIHILTE